MKLYQYKSDPTAPAIKDADIKQGIVTGYFSSFGNKDSDGDIITKGAFTKTIAENGPQSARPRIKHLINHDPSKPLGKLLTLTEDAKGLYYESQIGTHALGVDFIKMVDSGLISEHSIGFKTIKEEQKGDANYMIELRLFEGSSLTAWGANEMTPLTGMKGLDVEQMNRRLKALDKFCKNTDATDETIELLLIEIKQLQQYIIDLKATEPNKITLPDERKDVKQARDWKQLTDLFN